MPFTVQTVETVYLLRLSEHEAFALAQAIKLWNSMEPHEEDTGRTLDGIHHSLIEAGVKETADAT